MEKQTQTPISGKMAIETLISPLFLGKTVQTHGIGTEQTKG